MDVERDTEHAEPSPSPRRSWRIAVTAGVAAVIVLGAGSAWAITASGNAGQRSTADRTSSVSASTATPAATATPVPASTATPVPATPVEAGSVPDAESAPAGAEDTLALLTREEAEAIPVGTVVDQAAADAIRQASPEVLVFGRANGERVVYRPDQPLPASIRADLQADLDATERLSAAPAPTDYAGLQHADVLARRLDEVYYRVVSLGRPTLVVAQHSVGLGTCAPEQNCLRFIVWVPQGAGEQWYDVIGTTAEEARAQVDAALAARGETGRYDIFVRS